MAEKNANDHYKVKATGKMDMANNCQQMKAIKIK
jgi:hypothetical protein